MRRSAFPSFPGFVLGLTQCNIQPHLTERRMVPFEISGHDLFRTPPYLDSTWIGTGRSPRRARMILLEPAVVLASFQSILTPQVHG